MARWDKLKSRGRVEDRRAVTAAGTISVTGILLLMGINYLMGGNPLDVLSQVDVSQVQREQQTVKTDEFEGKDDYEVFVSTVLGSNNDAWKKSLNNLGKDYVEPKLVLFRNRTNSACGGAISMMGPHYCPLDQTIYLDETFFDELTNRLGAKGGDVAEAYVISHEVGHHVQNILGLVKGRKSNKESVKLELQADCFAGLWASTLKDKNILEPNEISEAMDAAAAVGDDRIQKRTTGHVNEESWTHGSSKQRLEAFTLGYSGDLKRCL